MVGFLPRGFPTTVSPTANPIFGATAPGDDWSQSVLAPQNREILRLEYTSGAIYFWSFGPDLYCLLWVLSPQLTVGTAKLAIGGILAPEPKFAFKTLLTLHVHNSTL